MEVVFGRNASCIGYRRTRIEKQRRMKRIGNIYQQIISIDNLMAADAEARKGKAHSYGVRLHDDNRIANIFALYDSLLTKTFRTSEYDVFKIFEPKERLIYRLPYYPDRIVHHAIMRVLEPIWGRALTHNTFSCIKGRGIERCANYVSKVIRKHRGEKIYCLKIDITKFYPSINHDVLKALVRKKIKDTDLLWLLDEIIDSTEGLPIGNYSSQFLANLTLCYFMHSLNEVYKVPCCEYADDIVVFGNDKSSLRQLFLNYIKPYIEDELKLKVKSNWQIFPIAENRQDKHGRGLDYVGYVFYRKQRLIRKAIKQNLCRNAAKLNKKKINEKQYRMALAPWIGWAKHSNAKNLINKITKYEINL